MPEHYGPLPPGDVIALAANPRVVARLTGADPAAVRAVARTDVAGRAAAARAAATLADTIGSRAPTTAGTTRRTRRRRPRLGARVIDSLRRRALPRTAPACGSCWPRRALAYDPVEIDLRDRPAWLYEKNPAGKVPVLEEDGWVLPESAVISEYLNERYPEPPLWPDDPGERAAGAAARLPLRRLLEAVLRAAARRGGRAASASRRSSASSTACSAAMPWLTGREFGLADVAFLPWMLRARDMLGFSLDPWPDARRLARARRRAAVGRRRASSWSRPL